MRIVVCEFIINILVLLFMWVEDSLFGSVGRCDKRAANGILLVN